MEYNLEILISNGRHGKTYGSFKNGLGIVCDAKSISECIEETVDFVINKLKPKYEFEKVNIYDVVSEDWNSYWEKYYVRGC